MQPSKTARDAMHRMNEACLGVLTETQLFIGAIATDDAYAELRGQVQGFYALCGCATCERLEAALAAATPKEDSDASEG